MWGVISSFGDVSKVMGKIFERGWVGGGGVVLKWRRKIRVHFVLDDWKGVGLLHILIPRVFWIAPNKESSFKNRYV